MRRSIKADSRPKWLVIPYTPEGDRRLIELPEQAIVINENVAWWLSGDGKGDAARLTIRQYSG
jgi:hypothetical protein